jgi:CRP-like cAMP-binding protein
MEFGDLASAFTPEGLAGQLVLLLLVAAVLQTRLARTRGLVAIAGLLGCAHALLLRGDLVAAIWWGVLFGAALLVIGRRAAENSRVRFTPEEETMLRGVFAALPRSRARHLLDQGLWLSGGQGDVLLREDEPVGHLYYLASGEARVLSHGRQIASCREGELIGEVALLSGDQATATVVLDGPARFWCAPATVLRPYLQTHEDVRRALEQGFAQSIKNKLRQSNERIAEAGGVTA